MDTTRPELKKLKVEGAEATALISNLIFAALKPVAAMQERGEIEINTPVLSSAFALVIQKLDAGAGTHIAANISTLLAEK